MELISKAAAIDAIISETIYPDRETIDKVCGESYSKSNGWVGGIRDAINAVEDVNTVDAIPVEWILHIAETLENNGSKNRSGAIRAMVDLWNGEIG